MIVESVKRAIVQVVDADGRTVLGTGFLVAEGGVVLTARHVVGTRAAVLVSFGGGAPIAAAWLDGGSGELDWALLRIEQVAAIPDGVAPVPWSPLEGAEATWYSFGHAELYAGAGGPFNGSVLVAHADALDLGCAQLDGKTYAEARGLSGGPCVVGGEATGVIVSVLHQQVPGTWNGPILGGQVIALPIAAFAPRTKYLPDELSVLPWQRDFVAAIEGLAPAAREIAAGAAALANPIAGPRLPRRVARQMIRGRIETTARVIVDVGKNLRAELAAALMRHAQTLWVAPEAAAHLAAIAMAPAPPPAPPPAVGLLATDYGWSAEHHFARAAEHHRGAAGPGAPRWSHVLVQDVHEEPFVDAAIEALRRALDPRADAKRIERRLARERVVAFVACAPRDDLVARVRAEWPGLAIVFLSRAVPSGAAAPGVVAVSPAATPDEEDLAREANEAAWESVNLVGVWERDAPERIAS